MLKGNAIVGQSGGPTAAINATLAGVIRGAIKNSNVIETLYGMRNGIEGFLKEDFVNLFQIFKNDKDIDTLAKTPAAALGSCRRKLKSLDEDRETYQKIFEIFAKYNIRYFFYIGGNDSMDTVSKLSKFAQENDYEIFVVGVPKTIDNDLMSTDHTPGFGSAAKFVATTMKEFIRDTSVYKMKAVTIVEIMGRDAGWLTASAALPRLSGETGPDLVYLPECVFDIDKFISDANEALSVHPAVLVAVSEGVKLADGSYVGAGNNRAIDAFGHTQLSGTGRVLEQIVKERIGCKVRSIELSLTQRCAGHILSATDISESLEIGEAAVKFALNGETGIMMIYVREPGDNYKVNVSSAKIENIANAVRTVPKEYLDSKGSNISESGLKYLSPLIMGEVEIEYENGMPKHFVI